MDQDIQRITQTIRDDFEKIRTDLMDQMMLQTRVMVLSYIGWVVALSGIIFGAMGRA